MMVATQQRVLIGDVAANRRLRLGAMVNILQKTAILRTQQAGTILNSLSDFGIAVFCWASNGLRRP